MNEKEKTEIAPQQAAHVSTHVDYGDHAGGGWGDTSQSDIGIPMVGIVQTNSPQVKPQHPKYIEGAQVGDLFNTVRKTIIGQPFVFVPCYAMKAWVEWIPRQGAQPGGFVAAHPLDNVPEGWKPAPAGKSGKVKKGLRVLPNGNELVDTAYWYGYRLAEFGGLDPAEPLVVPFSSTKFGPFRGIMAKLWTMRGRPPIYAFRLRFGTFPDTNPLGEFWNYMIEPATVGASGELVAAQNTTDCMIPPMLDGQPHPLLVLGKTICEQVQGGKTQAAYQTSDDDRQGGVDSAAPLPF